MRIMINAVEQVQSSATVVASTEIGTIQGVWKGTIPPNVDQEYHVELTIQTMANDIILSKKDADTKVMVRDDQVLFIGYCEGMDNEVYYIRFNVDWLEMVEIPENIPEIAMGDYVEFSAKIDDIWIYPY